MIESVYMLLHSYEQLISGGSLFIIFIVMISNGFFSFPSSQILYITLGVFIAQGKLSLVAVALFGALGNAIGNQLMFEITRKHGEKAVKSFLPLTDEMISSLKETFREKSVWWLAVGKLTPSLKVAIPLLAGIAKTHRVLTFLIFTITSFVWALLFLSLGIFFGKSFSFGVYSLIIGLVGVIVALYFIHEVKKRARKEVRH